jgi:tRNA (cmo5U34)-methyltransferase
MNSWTFNTEEITKKFDSHVREQLPWYDMVTETVAFITRNYLTPVNSVVDIGCSTGNMIDKLLPLVRDRDCDIVGFENSVTMYEHVEQKYLHEKHVEIEYGDITEMYIPSAQVYILFLTMMFIPINKREGLLNELRARCKKGGAIIVVDKINDHGGYFSTVLKRLTWHYKILQGAKPEDIVKKEMQLCGVQIPIDVNLVQDGKMFFRMGDFAGWVIEC